MFQKYQPKKPTLNPFEEAEEDNYQSPTADDSGLNPFEEELENVNDANNSASTNPFEDSNEFDDSNPFSDKYSDSYSSLERQQKKKKAPTPPRSKSQTLPQNVTVKTDSELKPSLKVENKGSEHVKEKAHRYLKSPKKKAPPAPRPVYQGTPPSSPKEKRRSRPITPPPHEQGGGDNNANQQTPKQE